MECTYVPLMEGFRKIKKKEIQKQERNSQSLIYIAKQRSKGNKNKSDEKLDVAMETWSLVSID